MGSDLTQQPSMFTTFLCEPIDFISSISSKNWSLASSSVESLHERKNIGPVIYTKTNLNVKKILAVINATYAVAKRMPEKIRLAGIRTLTSAIPVQRSNQLS